MDAQRRIELVQDWRQRANRLEEYARGCRRDGFVQGPEGAEDAEASAADYRRAANELEAEGT